MKKKIRTAAIIICIAVIIIEIVGIIKDKSDLAAATVEYDSIRNEYALSAAGNAVSAGDDGYPEMEIEFDKLREKNADVTAWIYIPCLEISYPVVKENEIDEYLHKTFDGKKNNSGCLFEDVLSDENFCGMHDMIFGHNMKDGSMFGSLKKIHSSENGKILEDNPYVYINTGDTIYRYEAFAYEITTAGSGAYCEVKSNDEYDAFIEYVISNDQWDNDKKYNFESRPSILTLSTCSGFAGGNRRFVIHTYKESEKKIR